MAINRDYTHNLTSPIPFHRPSQAIFEIHLGFIAEMLFCEGDVGEGMLDVAAALAP